MSTPQNKLKTLTPEEYRDKWIGIGLSTEPADRPRAEKAIADMYKAIGLEPPRIVWCGSPLSLAITGAFLRDESRTASVGRPVWDPARGSVGMAIRTSVFDTVRDAIRTSVRDDVCGDIRASIQEPVWDAVWDSVAGPILDSVREIVRGDVEGPIDAPVWDSVRASIEEAVETPIRDSVWDGLPESVRAVTVASGYGQHDANWLVFYEYARDVLGLTEPISRMAGLFEQAKSAGWYLSYRHICMMAERHCVLERDAQGLLHCLSAPAVRYPDGWSIYAVHGIRVPQYIIERPHEITIERIESEADAEVRRIMIERYRSLRP